MSRGNSTHTVSCKNKPIQYLAYGLSTACPALHFAPRKAFPIPAAMVSEAVRFVSRLA